MRRVVVQLALAVLLTAGCASVAPSSVDPGDGPATDSSETSGKKPATTKKQKVASFQDKYTYPDGVRVEVTKIKHTKLGKYAAADGVKVGAPVQVLSVRVTNGTDAKLDSALGSGTMTYGPDGDEAADVFDSGINAMEGQILPGKAKTGTYGYAVPKKYLKDATYEFNFDFEHEAAIFTGSLK